MALMPRKDIDHGLQRGPQTIHRSKVVGQKMQAASWQPVPPRLIAGESIPPGKHPVISLLSQQFYKAHQAAEWWFYACIEKILWRHICQRLFLHFAALSTDRFQPSGINKK
jgi:hypothetical protein